MLLVVATAVVWLAAGFLSFRSGVKDANARLPKAVEASLAPQDGLLLSEPSLILLLGTDGDMTAARADARRSDSILLVRTDPERQPARCTSRSRATCASTFPASDRTRSTRPSSSAGRR